MKRLFSSSVKIEDMDRFSGKQEKRSKEKHQPEETPIHAIIIQCMDWRIQSFEIDGFKSEECYIIRNGGGRVTDDAIRSAVLAIRLFAVDKVFIIHHTDCGLEKVSDPQVRELLHKSLGPAHLGDKIEFDKHNFDKYRQADYVAFLAFESLEQSVVNDVVRFRQNVLVSERVAVSGYVYDVDTNELKRIVRP